MKINPLNLISIFVLLALLTACSNGGGGDDEQNIPELPINLNSVFIEGDFLLNGGAFPVSQYENGLISLADGSNNQAILGNSYSGNYQAHIVSGTYNSQYLYLQGGNLVPINEANNVATGLALMNDQILDIDVTAYSVRFVFTLNGVDFPVSEYDDAVFYLQRSDGGERMLLGNSHSAIDPVWLMPGTYDVIYQVETPGALVPLNQNAVVATVVIDAMTSGVNVDITSVDFRFDSTLDGNPFPASQYEDGDFLLRNDAGDSVDIADTYELPVTVNVIEGTYNIVYAHESGTSVPLNSQAIVAANQVIDTGNSSVNLDILTALITPDMSHNGNAFPVSEYNDANIYLRGTNNVDDQLLLSNTHTASPAAVNVVQGTYDVVYEHETGSEVPQNTNAVVASNQLLNSDQVLPVSVTSVDITGIFTLNGNNFTVNPYQVAEFHLRGVDAGDEFLLGYSNEGTGIAKLIAGTYDVVYRHTDGNNIPRNPENTIMTDQLLDTTKSIRINVTGSRVKPVFTLNNGAFPDDNNNVASFYLHGESDIDRIYIGKSYITQNDSVFVINDNYDVKYEYFKGDLIPVNERALVTNVDIP